MIAPGSKFCMYCGEKLPVFSAGQDGINNQLSSDRNETTFVIKYESGEFSSLTLHHSGDTVYQIERTNIFESNILSYDSGSEGIKEYQDYYTEEFSHYGFITYSGSFVGPLITEYYQYRDLNDAENLEAFQYAGGPTDVFAGSSSISYAENQKCLLENGWKILDLKDIDVQLQVILDNRKMWDLEDYADPIPGCYAITDLDHNGRVEIISAVNYSSGNLTHLEIHEVNKAMSGLNRVDTDQVKHFSPLFQDSIPVFEDAFYPNLSSINAPPEFIGLPHFAKINAYVSPKGEWYYPCSNFNSVGADKREDIKEWLSLSHGSLSIQPVVWAYYEIPH
ncbi:MAG: hypothetical protein IJI61_02140 [Oscillospiraceae bacterium]|nr:hypothetical protein [Oscillospiraceae bacterium]